MFWDSPFYKPKNKLCEDFWVEFMRAAKIIMIFDSNLTKAQKAREGYREPDVYSVFNKMRQDIHDELPYSHKFIDEIDRSVEREVRKEIERTTS